ncbi:MAG: hypothetical protein QGG40_16520, partial [Myxococcota bacterium]|nr:hypothetical protein [Myxococcota bacterium]
MTFRALSRERTPLDLERLQERTKRLMDRAKRIQPANEVIGSVAPSRNGPYRCDPPPASSPGRQDWTRCSAHPLPAASLNEVDTAPYQQPLPDLNGEDEPQEKTMPSHILQGAQTRYEDLGLIGMGSMGEIRRVRDRQL